MKRPIIGIDLGTSNSSAAYIKEKKPEIIINERGERLTPSVVSFKNKREVLVGELAKNRSVMEADYTISHVKRDMGTSKRYSIANREYTPVEISALILRKIKQYTEKFLGKRVYDAVITVPAYFNDNQRQATLKAGKLAGLNVLKLLNEPVAAALAYYLNRNGEERILVVDFGGGTLDITLMEYSENVFKVTATGGSTSLGGVNIDQLLAKYITEEFEKQHSIDLHNDPIAYQQILLNAERAKIDLSTTEETKIFIPYITATQKGSIHLEQYITRRQFNNLISPILSELKDHLTSLFKKSSLPYSWVTSLIFAGGSTRIPAVQDVVIKTLTSGKGKNNFRIYRDINPDEVVALGAGVLAGILSGDIEEVQFYDITSHDLGVEDNEGNFVPIIPAGINYPTESSKFFTTTEDNQDKVTIHVIQREQNDNSIISLGRFILKGIKRAKAGQPNIDVTFSIDKHGILNVSALDVDTGEYNEIAISGRDWLVESDREEKRGSGLKIL